MGLLEAVVIATAIAGGNVAVLLLMGVGEA
jgi:hypothetical protein